MGKILLLVLILAAGAAAVLDASERGMFSEPRGAAFAIEGQGPLFSTADDGRLTRSAGGLGRIGLLFVGQSSAAMRAAARELSNRTIPATFALTATAVIADPSLPADLRRGGHEIALAGFAARDSARLPFWLWAAEQTLARRVVEGSGAAPVLTYGGERLAAPPFDATAALLARRAAAIGLVPATGVGELDHPALPTSPTDDPDGILLLLGDHAAELSAIRPILAFIDSHGVIPSRVSEMAGVASDAPSTSPLLGAVAVWSVELGKGAGMLAQTLIVGVTLLALVRLTIVLVVASRRPARPARFPVVHGRLAVLVPAYNEEVVIGDTLRAILRSGYRELEVVVIDDGSPDQTADEARKVAETDGRIRVIVQPNGGKSSALNRGLSATTAPYIAVVDADSLVEPDAFGEMLRLLADPKVGAVAGNVKVGNRGGLLGAMQHLEYVVSISLDRRFLDAVDSIIVVPGALGVFRRDVVERAGGFPLNTIAEDADLTVAIGRLGYQTRHSSKARVWTEVPIGWAALRKQRFRWSYGILQVLWKHRGAIVSRRATNVGRFGIPYTVVFSYLFTALTPLTDLGFVYWLVLGPQAELIALYALFLLLQVAVAMVALRLDREPIWHALLVIPQRLGYVQFLAAVVLSALSAALSGVPVGWGKALRRGLQDRVTGQVRDAERRT